MDFGVTLAKHELTAFGADGEYRAKSIEQAHCVLETNRCDRPKDNTAATPANRSKIIENRGVPNEAVIHSQDRSAACGLAKRTRTRDFSVPGVLIV
jgi:hypothetical protein